MVSVKTLTQKPWLETFELAFLAEQKRLYPSDSGLHQACRYALAGQGKRIRPLLALAAAEAAGSDWQAALPAAVALEFVHTYSLVHDDLPCMDDDELRRGRATTHKVFDEATALLAGDALLTDAFQILAKAALSPTTILALVQTLSLAAGGRGMVYGQELDMHWTARTGYSANDLDTIHKHKTGALIAAATVMGGIASGAEQPKLDALAEIGEMLGLCFQIIDDLLDQSTATGKSLGKDHQSGKLTYLSIMSEEEARQRCQVLTSQAMAAIAKFGPPAHALGEIAGWLLDRQA